ncbi:hypothetical protein [Taibaiella koreensis]|uniref:hypothetical protein n=1 Tax=Taibaiella koreensis TaxID=1268548 RepID=UPI000E59F40F|nr:hypothetical protein [Taibaiella koreensis]
MKRIAFLFLFFLGTITLVRAQDVFDTKQQVTWLGLDFSALKLVKSDEMVTNDELQNKYFPGWNDLVMNEPKKFDIAKAVDRASVDNDLSAVTDANKSAKGDFITTDKAAFEHLNKAQIQQMVKKYNLKGKSGIGLVLVVEAMDKNRKEASMWVTFINMGTKEVLLSKAIIGESGGFGFRNYWAGAINKVLKAMPGEMKKWKKGN